jgi:Fuc2NAc and GlcNAc transferase
MVVEISRSVLDFICLTSFLFPFYADELSTMIVRLKDRENLLQPHRRHLYQLLANENEIPHWQVSTGYGLSQLIIGVSVLMMRRFGSTVVIAALAVYFGAFFLFCHALRKNLATSQ